MSKGGHLLTAAALAYAVYERSASPTLAVGTLLGSSFPDVGELVQFRGRWRSSLIPHRTLTHWPSDNEAVHNGHACLPGGMNRRAGLIPGTSALDEACMVC